MIEKNLCIHTYTFSICLLHAHSKAAKLSKEFLCFNGSILLFSTAGAIASFA